MVACQIFGRFATVGDPQTVHGCKISVQTPTNYNTITVIIRGYRHMSICRPEPLFYILKSSIRHILKEDLGNLGMRCVCSMWVTHMLTREQLEKRFEHARRNYLLSKRMQYLTRVTTCYESWVLYFEPKMQQENNTRRSLSSLKKEKVKQ